jgi:plastocyanin
MNRNRLWLVVPLCCALVAFVACGGGEKTAETPAPAAAAPAADMANGGTVSGTIAYTGPDPDTPIAMNADPVCLGLHKTPVDTNKVEVKDGKLGNVFIYVKTGLEGKTFPVPAEGKELDQQGCQYHPKIFGIQVGQKLTIKNGDGTLHNIHALPTVNTEFNQGQPFQNMSFDKTFDKPEIMVHFKCDVHPWMSAYMGVLDHPFYAVSDESGNYTLPKLPPGKYTIEAWHETLGTKTQDVEVTPGGAVTASFDFTPGT